GGTVRARVGRIRARGQLVSVDARPRPRAAPSKQRTTPGRPGTSRVATDVLGEPKEDGAGRPSAENVNERSVEPEIFSHLPPPGGVVKGVRARDTRPVPPCAPSARGGRPAFGRRGRTTFERAKRAGGPVQQLGHRSTRDWAREARGGRPAFGAL